MNPTIVQSASPLISVVVIGRNEGERLKRCLESVNGMTRHNFQVETIYVDSGSSDGSLGTAAGLGVETISLHSTRPTAALGRNAGWKAGHGEFVLFLDGDTVLESNFLGSALLNFVDPCIAIVWGHRREVCPNASVYNRVLDLDWIYAPGLTAFCGGDALFRRSILVATGGFDDTLIAGEEPELCRRIVAMGGRILHVNHAMTGHDLAMHHFHQYWKRASRAGHAFAEVSARFTNTPHPFWLEESTHNRTRAMLLLGVPLFALILSLALKNIWPMTALVILSFAIVARTAWKARWKNHDRLTLLLYGIHSHFQQIPIFVGQLQYWLNRRRGTRAGLVEYKRN
jgi:glycosyltransferase involved in cell wall biosynthesis